MAWEGLVPAALIGGALFVAGEGTQVVHKLFHDGRIRRVNRDAFDHGLDWRDEHLVSSGLLRAGPVYGVNEALLFADAGAAAPATAAPVHVKH
jgi:hypothetical protein